MTLLTTDLFKLTRSRQNPEIRDRIDYMTALLSDYLPMLTNRDTYVLTAKVQQGDLAISYMLNDGSENIYSVFAYSNLLSYLRQIVHYGCDDALRDKYKEQLARAELRI
jgi:hypothetical protein